MALVGEARIKVVADTSKVREEIQKAFGNMEKDADKAGNSVSKSFNRGMSNGMGNGNAFKKFTSESKQLSSQFHKAIRSSYKWQAATGALLQSIMALGGGLLALVGNIAGAASAGIALVGVMAQIKVASMVAKSAFKGVMEAVKKDSKGAGEAGKTIKELREEMQQLAFAAEEAALGEEAASIKLEKARESLARVQNLPPDNRARREAELAYKEAELGYRKAKDKNADAEDAIINPKKKKGSIGDDPYKDLTKSQKEFAIYLKSVMPEFKKLNEAAASGFLPEVKKGMQEMFKGGLFDRLVKGFEDVGKGLGKATKNFAGTMFDPQNQNNLSTFFKNTATTTGTLGTVLGKAFSGFLTLMTAINPLITRFTSFLEMKATGFSKNMQGDFANVQAFFKQAGDAAAGWGTILGRIFDKFKGMIKANVGPGTGGQLLLDYFKQGTDGFRGLDGAAGEFARKNHFLASATNLKAMLESVSKIFGFMSDLGTDPAVASFWGILSELEGPLSHIFESITGSSDELAKLLVTVVEIVASFTDAGQLNAYMGILSNIFGILGGIVRTLSPVLAFFGPAVGAIGALVTTMLLLKKVTMLVTGTTMVLGKGIGWVTRMTQGLILANKTHLAQETLSMRIKRALIMLTTAEGRAKMMASLKVIFSAGASQKAAQADAQAAIAKAAATGATVAQSVVTTAAIGPTMALSAAINSAIWPLTLIVAAIALVVVGIIALVGWLNQIKADQVKKAGKEIDSQFTATKGKIIGAAEAQDMWSASLLSMRDDQKTGIKSIKEMGKALNEQGIYVQGYGTVQSEAHKNAKEALDVYMSSLAKLAKKNLPEAQRQFRNMIVSSGMNKQATMDSIVANKDMVKSLEKQAKAMGDTIMNADGTVNALKALDYAIGEGSYVRQKAILEQRKFAETFKNAASTFIDSNEAMQNATTDGKLDLKKYVKELKNQGGELTSWRANITKLNGLFTDKKVLQGIIAQGSAGAGLVQALASGGQKAVTEYQNAQKEILKAKQDADTFTRAYSSTEAASNALKNSMKGAGSMMARTMERFADDAASGMGTFELAAKYNISEKALIAEQKRLDAGGDLAKNVNLTAQWDKPSLQAMQKELAEKMGTITLTAVPGPAKGNANGGVITRALGGIVGTVRDISKFADGYGPSYNGRVTGPGTARSDQIPAMISNGEFVMNARATAANLDLLNAMNSNKGVSAGNQIAITVNAAPGMDEQQVAAQVARQLDAQLSKGGAL